MPDLADAVSRTSNVGRLPRFEEGIGPETRSGLRPNITEALMHEHLALRIRRFGASAA